MFLKSGNDLAGESRDTCQTSTKKTRSKSPAERTVIRAGRRHPEIELSVRGDGAAGCGGRLGATG
jgi:hypothetical protein